MDIFGILDISYDVLDESLLGLDSFQPNNPDFSLVQTLLLGAGFGLPTSGITYSFFVAKFPASFFTLAAASLLLVIDEVS